MFSRVLRTSAITATRRTQHVRGARNVFNSTKHSKFQNRAVEIEKDINYQIDIAKELRITKSSVSTHTERAAAYTNILKIQREAGKTLFKSNIANSPDFLNMDIACKVVALQREGYTTGGIAKVLGIRKKSVNKIKNNNGIPIGLLNCKDIPHEEVPYEELGAELHEVFLLCGMTFTLFFCRLR